MEKTRIALAIISGMYTFAAGLVIYAKWLDKQTQKEIERTSEIIRKYNEGLVKLRKLNILEDEGAHEEN